MCGVLSRSGEVVSPAVEMPAWIVLALFGGAIFVMTFVASLPSDSRRAIISKRILHAAFALAFAWMIGKEFLRFFR